MICNLCKMTTKTLLSRVLSFFYLLAICFVCFESTGNLPSMQSSILGLPMDKVIHFMMFAPFPILAYLSFDHKPNKPGKSVLFIFLTILTGCAIGAATEIVQKILPTRAMDINDFYADAAAVVSVSVFVLVIDLFKHQK